MNRLIQLIPSHHRHDAAGAEVLLFERLLAAAGWRVETYADEIDPSLVASTRPSSELDSADTDGAVALYHYCAASPMTSRFLELHCPKVIIYYNITPHSFFEPYSAADAAVCRDGREQLRKIAEAVDLAIAHSDYSRLELVEAGFDVTRTIPYLFDPERYSGEPDPAMLRRLDGPPVVLFTGRHAPNKKPDDFIRVAAAHAAAGYPPARFVVAGKRSAVPAYAREIDALLGDLGLPEERLLLTDEVSQAELVAAYRSASLFLSLSRHEGFMVPLLECMLFDVPVLALARAAVPETLGDAGVLFDSTDPEVVASMVDDALGDADLRAELVERGRRRLKRYDLDHWVFVFRALLESL